VGATGQFDVVADGEVVASRGHNFLTRLLGGGWPDEEHVVEKLRERQKAAG
jgi:hypothetical protein